MPGIRIKQQNICTCIYFCNCKTYSPNRICLHQLKVWGSFVANVPPLYSITQTLYHLICNMLASIISVRGCRPGKTVQMTESEVRALCLKSREIFLSQPILLELEAPLKICGMCIKHIYQLFFNIRVVVKVIWRLIWVV